MSANSATQYNDAHRQHWPWIALLCLGACGVPVQKEEPAVGVDMSPAATAETRPAASLTAAEPAETRTAELACARLTIAATGDIMIGTDFPKNHLPDDDAASFLADVKPVISSADIAFGNLEGVLMDGGEPVKECKDPDACYLFRSPTRYAGRLSDAGFTVMSLANNHARDFGEEGRTATMEALDAAGIKHSGRAGDIATWPDGEVRAVLIAFAPFRESNPMLDPVESTRLVRELDASYDVIIISMHGGAEGADASHVPFTTEFYYGEDRGNVVNFSRSMIDAGADLVIGHGPHLPRAMEIYRDRLIAYSLGNFATYYGISVGGEKKLAPILVGTLDGNGRFTGGEIVSAIQVRPGGPRLDDRHRAYERIRELTEQDFSGGGIRFQTGGVFSPVADAASPCPQSSAKAER